MILRSLGAKSSAFPPHLSLFMQCGLIGGLIVEPVILSIRVSVFVIIGSELILGFRMFWCLWSELVK